MYVARSCFVAALALLVSACAGTVGANGEENPGTPVDGQATTTETPVVQEEGPKANIFGSNETGGGCGQLEDMCAECLCFFPDPADQANYCQVAGVCG
jgi:hypothetical protein